MIAYRQCVCAIDKACSFIGNMTVFVHRECMSVFVYSVCVKTVEMKNKPYRLRNSYGQPILLEHGHHFPLDESQHDRYSDTCRYQVEQCRLKCSTFQHVKPMAVMDRNTRPSPHQPQHHSLLSFSVPDVEETNHRHDQCQTISFGQICVGAHHTGKQVPITLAKQVPITLAKQDNSRRQHR